MSGGSATGKARGGEGVGLGSLTREVEEGVEDVEAFHVVPLDELVGIVVEDFGPGEGAWSHCECGEHLAGSCPSNHNPKPHRLDPRDPCDPPKPRTHPLRKRKPWAQTSRFPCESTFSRFPYRASNTSPLRHGPP